LNDIYVFDACALIALLTRETGYENVESIIKQAADGQVKIVMHTLNLYEVYNDVCRSYDETAALVFLQETEKSPITLRSEISMEMIISASALKRKYKMSLADSIGLAQTIISQGIFVTADHHELDVVARNEEIGFSWIR